MAAYEMWLTDDAGKRLALLTQEIEPFFISYTRTVSGLGSLNFGVSYKNFINRFNPFFRPDWRVEIWRSSMTGFPMRREDVFMLRKPNVYTRNDDVQALEFFGRNGIDLLMRRWVIQKNGTSYATKTTFADDMMKAIVSQQMLYGSALDGNGAVDNTRAWPQNEFYVQPNASAGPSITLQFPDRKVFDVVKDIKDIALQYNRSSSSNRKIYFDVVPMDIAAGDAPSGSTLGWEFRTYADLRGTNRTTLREFSQENENLETPSYSKDHLDEITSVIVKGSGRGDSQIAISPVQDTNRTVSSRWNIIEELVNASSQTGTTALQDAARPVLYKGRPIEDMQLTLMNVPGSNSVPRSLYGLDWDLGDLVRVSYADKQFNAEIMIIYVAVDDKGKETITGRAEIVPA